jgi:glycosyltransferase involved in cell wall biosynthesis
MKQLDVSIIICTYNRKELLRRALESVASQEMNETFSYEIVVVDDGSTDGTHEVVKEFAMKTQVSVNYVRENGCGIAHVRNVGVRESRGDWIAFTDDDQLVESHWLRELVMVAQKRGADCVGGNRALSIANENYLTLSEEARSMLGEETYQQEFQIQRRRDLPGTENLLIKRRVFDAIGGFDVYHLIPTYRLGQEYLKWASLRVGVTFSYLDWKQWGYAGMLFTCIARLGQAFLINTPYLLMAYLCCNRSAILGRKCLLWRAFGYARMSLFRLVPKLFPQRSFFERLEFRRERTSIGAC